MCSTTRSTSGLGPVTKPILSLEQNTPTPLDWLQWDKDFQQFTKCSATLTQGAATCVWIDSNVFIGVCVKVMCWVTFKTQQASHLFCIKKNFLEHYNVVSSDLTGKAWMQREQKADAGLQIHRSGRSQRFNTHTHTYKLAVKNRQRLSPWRQDFRERVRPDDSPVYVHGEKGGRPRLPESRPEHRDPHQTSTFSF